MPWSSLLGRQDSIISVEKYAKLRHGRPICNLGRKFEHTNGQNLDKDVFFVFFRLHLILGRKTD